MEPHSCVLKLLSSNKNNKLSTCDVNFIITHVVLYQVYVLLFCVENEHVKQEIDETSIAVYQHKKLHFDIYSTSEGGDHLPEVKLDI